MAKNGKRQTPSKSTGLPIKGNKKRAEAMLMEARKEMEDMLDVSSKKTFFRLFLRPLLESGLLRMTTPDQRSVSTQRYVRV